MIIKESDILDKIPIAPNTGFQIVSSYEKTNIETFIKAKATAYLGYFVDDDEKREALLKNGDQLSFSAKDVLKITVANAQAVDVEINKIPVSVGGEGEITAKIVRWYRDSENDDLYQLIINDWER